MIRQSGNLWINLRKPPEWGLNRLWESYVSIGPLGYLYHFDFFVFRLILPLLTYSTFDPPLSCNQFSSFSLTTNAIFVPFYKTIPQFLNTIFAAITLSSLSSTAMLDKRAHYNSTSVLYSQSTWTVCVYICHSSSPLHQSYLLCPKKNTRLHFITGVSLPYMTSVGF